MRKLILSILLVLSVLHSFSQFYNYRHFTTRDGLPSSEIYHVLQDSKGSMWFATDNGVSRYDGYTFNNFTTENGLPDNTVFEFYEDFKGRIWFISFTAQLSYFYNDSIYRFIHNDELIKSMTTPPNPVKNSFYVDSLNNVFYSDVNNGLRIIRHDGFVEKPENAILFDTNNITLINENNKHSTDSIFIHKNGKTRFTGVCGNGVYCRHGFKVILKHNKHFYLSSLNTLHTFDDSTNTYSRNFGSNIIWLSYSGNILWVGTRNGAFGFKATDISKAPEYKMLSGQSVSSVTTDKEGNVWFTTLNNGVYFLPDLTIQSVTKQNSGISSEQFSITNADQSRLFYCLANGSFGFIQNNKVKQLFEIEKDVISYLTGLDNVDDSTKIVHTGRDIYLIKENNNKFTLSALSPTAGVAMGGKTVLHDKDSTIWVGSVGGLNGLLNYRDAFSISFPTTPTPSVNSLLLFNDSSLIIGARTGLWKYNTNNKKLTNLGEYFPKLNVRITCLAKHATTNSLWIGTKLNGIYILKNDTLLKLSSFGKIESKFITSLTNKENEMWIGTKGSGIYRITINHLENGSSTIRNWNQVHGLLSNEINHIFTNDTAAFVSTNLGLNIIQYKQCKINDSPPPVYIEQIKINNKDTLLLNSYNLPHNENSLNIKLTGLTYKAHGNVMYKYRLKGSQNDTNWIYTSNRHIQLSYVSPGNYTFQAKAINENNIESETPAEFALIINPPFWRTKWFIVVVALTIILFTSIILFMFYRIRIREINKRNELEKEFIKNKNKFQREIEKYRQQALSQQMNPHFIFNSLNSIQYFIYQNEKALSNKYLTKFSQLIRIILENSQHYIIPIKDEFSALRLYLELEEMRLNGKLSFSIDIDSEIDTSFFQIPPLLIQPFVENAIWHGLVHKKNSGRITIKFINKEKVFLCSIEDDGVGRKFSKEIQQKKQKLHKSLGSKITQRRLELFSSTYGKQMTIKYTDLCENPETTGTRVDIEIPKVSRGADYNFNISVE